MRGRLFTCDGKVYDMPALMRYALTYTGGVPCDSFFVRCAYSAPMAEILPRVTRFAALENGKTEFFGVVDDYTASCGEGGLTLEVSGRGMAALLIDSESEALCYERASMDEILRNHVSPFGIACTRSEAGKAHFSLAVKSGASHFSVLEESAKKCGAAPYFTKEGKLELRAPRAAAFTLDSSFPLAAALWREKRYGVISEITLIDRESGARTSVRNEDFLARGGLCRRVLYASKSDANPTETGHEKIESSKEGSRVLMLTTTQRVPFLPRDGVNAALPRLGISGRFRVSELVRRADGSGEITEVTLQGET